MPGLESLLEPGWVMNKPVLPERDTLRRMSALHQPIAEFVSSSLAGGDRPVSIAGDCPTAIAVLAGLQHAGREPVLVWLDAHGDFNIWETTPSGFLGGMPLAMLVGRGEQTLVNAVGLHPLPENQVILVGGRDLDPGERTALAGSKLHHLTDVASLLAHPLLARPLYIHLDTDILDPQQAPAMNYPAPGGPSVAKMQALFRSLAGTGRIMAVSLSSWNPELDGASRSREVCMALLRTLIEE